MMDDKDCEEYNNIGRKIPLKERFQYVSGKQITDGDTGKRVYEISVIVKSDFRGKGISSQSIKNILITYYGKL